MAPITQPVKNANVPKTDYSERAAINALYDELFKGIKSLKKGNVYTIDKAWEEIGQI